VDQLAAAIDAEMRLQAEIPLDVLRAPWRPFLVEEGAVVSAIIPVVIFSPLA
jgi:hypothetical protein